MPATAPDSGIVNASDSSPTRTLQVHSSTEKFSIIPTELPSVRLRGRIPLQTIDESEDTNTLAIAHLQQRLQKYTAASVSSNKPMQPPVKVAPAPVVTASTESTHEHLEPSLLSVSSSAPPAQVVAAISSYWWLIGLTTLMPLFLLSSVALQVVILIDTESGLVTQQLIWDWSMLSQLLAF